MANPLNVDNRTIFTADNLDVLRGINSECIDLIYLDPPFNSGRNRAAPIARRAGQKAKNVEFQDVWTLNDVKREWVRQLEGSDPALWAVVTAAGRAHSESMQAYLTFMAVRLIEMHRILKPTGTLYLHCDHTANSYLRLLLDVVFTSRRMGNEIIWHYGKMSNTSKNFPRNHDTILRYTKSDDAVFNPIKGGESEYRNRFQRYLTGNQVLFGAVKESNDKLIKRRAQRRANELGRALVNSDVLFDFDTEFKVQSDVVYESIIKGNDKQKTGFETQKPLRLLKRIILASSNDGDMVLDPFCGCATACIAAEGLNRQWIGIDKLAEAWELVNERLVRDLQLFGTVTVHRTDSPIRSDTVEDQLSPNIRELLYARQQGRCAGCGDPFRLRNLELDHIRPRSKGGANSDENVQLLCSWCNRTKGNRGMDYLHVRLREADS